MGASYELVVFDWDGTLMDSEARIVTCMQLAARDCGIAVPDRAAARDIIGLGLEEAVQRFFPALDRSGVAALTPSTPATKRGSTYSRIWAGQLA